MGGNRGIEIVKNSVSIDGNNIDLSVSREGAVTVEGKPISVIVSLELELSSEERAALLPDWEKKEIRQGVKIKITPTGDGNQICLDVFSDKGILPGRFVKLVSDSERGIILEVCDSEGNQIIDNNQKNNLVVVENDEIVAAS